MSQPTLEDNNCFTWNTKKEDNVIPPPLTFTCKIKKKCKGLGGKYYTDGYIVNMNGEKVLVESDRFVFLAANLGDLKKAVQEGLDIIDLNQYDEITIKL